MKTAVRIRNYALIASLAAMWMAGQAFGQGLDFHRWNFDFGGGVTPTLNSTSRALNTGWNITGGGGLNFSDHFGVILQAMYDGLGVNNSVLKEFDVPGANAHIWGFTLNPILRFRTADKVGFYLIAGPGYYRRVVNFTRPTTAIVNVYDPFFGYIFPVVIPAKQIIGTITNVGWGGNVGAGVTFKLGTGGAKFFTEVRYHYIATHPRATQILPITFGFRW